MSIEKDILVQKEAKELGVKLIDAVGKEDESRIDALLAQRASLDESVGYTALERAIIGGNAQLVNKLLEAKANINQAGSDGGAALHIAIFHGKHDMIDLLLKVKADLNQGLNSLGGTPLWLAITRQDAKAVQMLVTGKADFTRLEKKMVSLGRAAVQGNMAIVKILLRAKASPLQENSWGRTAFDSALTGHHTEIVEYMIQQDERGQRQVTLLAGLLKRPGGDSPIFTSFSRNTLATPHVFENVFEAAGIAKPRPTRPS